MAHNLARGSAAFHRAQQYALTNAPVARSVMVNWQGGILVGQMEMNYGTHSSGQAGIYPAPIPVYPVYPVYPGGVGVFPNGNHNGVMVAQPMPQLWTPAYMPQNMAQTRAYSAATHAEPLDHYQPLQNHLANNYKVRQGFLENIINATSTKEDLEKLLLALEDYRSRKQHLSMATTTRLVNKCCKLSELDGAMDILEQLLTQTQKYRVFPDRPGLRLSLCTLRKGGRIESMLQVFEQHRDNYKGGILLQLPPLCKAASHDEKTFNVVFGLFNDAVIVNPTPGKMPIQAITALSAAALKFGQNKKARKILDQIKAMGLEENQSSFGIRVQSLTNQGKLKEAVSQLKNAPEFCKQKLPEFTVKNLQEKVEGSEEAALIKVMPLFVFALHKASYSDGAQQEADASAAVDEAVSAESK
ncbi:hypothetical protein SARC_05833 [Sphaeroforma arctica JP610]|uniref:Pentacotripeptide-repeat region of PRORP domain-containing protein n=1 Tax=Sphaeroforma arctica JP610 TaxID=667725 RepID=A0A0L0FZ02_9EUKA|nr:hypothetical protein SARC_05833 [Sphaeroforma arctica JP610]KNC81859.1 hypothetical protein SARC_05833 [Sphaeroforma arctica JP610]|eukprot:XP_014155761.1 hypothetical protein SARC_05833 [Sphaeroforma arctica JP610]